MKQLSRLLIYCLIASIPGIGNAIGITDSQVQAALTNLDAELAIADSYLTRHQAAIDSLKKVHYRTPDSDTAWMQTTMEIADKYAAFNTDSALRYYNRAYQHAIESQLDSAALISKLKRATYLPLVGFTAEAIDDYESIDSGSLPPDMLELYYESGRQMYSYIASFYPSYPEAYGRWQQKALDAQKQLIQLLDIASPKYKLNQGEYYYSNGEHSKAKVILEELLDNIPAESNMYARATHFLANIAKARGEHNGYVYYMALSAVADIKSATMEVTSLQELGAEMFENKDVDRAHTYLSRALANAVQCHAMMRMIQSSEALPIIEAAHIVEIDEWRNRMYGVIVIMALLLAGVGLMLLILRREMKRMKVLQMRLEKANHAKEVYISQFLNLCSIYMDKLNQFCKIANRKISTGKVDDLYRLTKSGKFVEEQSKEFYDIFDNAFLHIYPGFVKSVNALLRPEEQIELKEGELLNTDLRILAFMRLGIEEGTRIAQVLNYSVYTIYTYRNKLRNRAIDRNTFEADVMKISSIS